MLQRSAVILVVSQSNDFSHNFIFYQMIASMFFSRIKPESFEALWFIALTWFGSNFMGFWGTFILISFPLDIINGVVTLFNHNRPEFRH
ncbi:MAG: hypothetical protein H7336_04455 [Bacteriovorax sp.]|nr:hypothetical protein [Bacteriovorax sp.]